MPVERADADAGLAGDLLQRGVDAVFGEGRRSHFDQSVTIALRVGAQRLLRSGGCLVLDGFCRL